jgi:hypothetical protein
MRTFSKLFALGALLAACGGEEERFAGAYKGTGIELVLERSGESYKGTLTVKGAAHPLKAEIKEDRLVGIFTVAGSEFPFAATVDGDALKLESAGVRHELHRVKAAPVKNPLEEVGNPLAGVPEGG